MSDDMFTHTLDLPRTIEQAGKLVCFTKTTMFEEGMVFKPVRVSSTCYIPDADINRKESNERNKLLRP
jgi:hypothetical protein